MMDNEYTPNHIPLSDRAKNLLSSVFLLIYGAYGVWKDDLFVMGRKGGGIHLHHVQAWMMYGAFVCASLVMLSVVVDHYDKRDNEIIYQKFANTFRFSGWGFFILSIILWIGS